MINNCNLCAEVERRPVLESGLAYAELVATGGNIILESENFLVVPSVGPLDDSHVMCVPKHHVNNFSEIDSSQVGEYQRLLDELSAFYADRYGETLIFFESGAGRISKYSGGCIVHAHIHCLMDSEDFHRRILDEIPMNIVECVRSAADVERGYVWYRDGKGVNYLRNDPLLPSQFLRYIYAETTSKNSRWNWRRHINEEGIFRVIDRYRDLGNKLN